MQIDEQNFVEVGCCAMAAGKIAVELALAQCGYTPPTIYMHPKAIGLARRIAQELVVNYAPDDTLSEYAWYVEWGGKRYGSVGC